MSQRKISLGKMKAYRPYVIWYLIDRFKEEISSNPRLLSEILYLTNLTMHKHDLTLGYRFFQRQIYVGVTDEDIPYDITFLQYLGLIKWEEKRKKVLIEIDEEKREKVRGILEEVYGKETINEINTLYKKLKKVEVEDIPFCSLIAFIINPNPFLNESPENLLKVFRSSIKIKEEYLSRILYTLRDMPFEENMKNRIESLIVNIGKNLD